jgi:hypothetical protein
MLRLVVSLCCAIVSLQLFAFNCYFTLVKDSCWTNYSVKVEAIDAEKNKILVSAEVPKGQSWGRQNFTCRPAQKLMFQATFEPSFWQSEKGKVYRAVRYWILPNEEEKGDVAWEVPVCFPTAFASVPFPPDATGNCQCRFDMIPAIKPQ